MIKVMLVDDEIPFRTRTKEIIDWKSMGFEITAEASNGEAALEILEEKQIDIILVDMNMPVMNGSDFIETLSRRYPRIKAIGLSGYDDYDYLRKTMKFGAVDYLLKYQLDKNTLSAALEAAVMQIEKENKVVARNAIIEDQLEENRTILQRKMVQKLFSGQVEKNDDLTEQMKYLGMTIVLSNGLIILFSIDQLWKIRQKDNQDSLQVLINSTVNIAAEILKEYNRSSVFHLEEKTFVIFLDLFNRRSMLAAMEYQHTIINRIQASVKRYLNLSLSFFAGTPYYNVSEISSSYHQALSLMNNHFYDGIGSIRFSGDCNTDKWQNNDNNITMDIEIEKKLSVAVTSADELSTKQILGGYFETLMDKRVGDKSFKIICIELIHLLSRIARDLGIVKESNKYDPLDAYERINKFDTSDDLCKWIQEKYQETISFIRLYCLHERYSPVITKALQFVQLNFSEQISLGDAAEFAGVSNSYLSRSFKEETGKGFAEHVTACRIQSACQKIEAGGNRIKDVAVACGFQNYTYFFKVFKQITGMTPNEYEVMSKKKNTP